MSCINSPQWDEARCDAGSAGVWVEIICDEPGTADCWTHQSFTSAWSAPLVCAGAVTWDQTWVTHVIMIVSWLQCWHWVFTFTEPAPAAAVSVDPGLLDSEHQDHSLLHNAVLIQWSCRYKHRGLGTVHNIILNKSINCMWFRTIISSVTSQHKRLPLRDINKAFSR